MPNLRHARQGFCLWCGGRPPRAKNTTEHLTPRWVLRAFPYFPSENNSYTACMSCNGRRGAMPAALYTSVRGDPGALSKAHTYWSGVAGLFSDTFTKFGPRLKDSFADSVVSDFCAMIPEETGIHDPRLDHKNTAVLFARRKQHPTKQEWIEIARGYPHIWIAQTANRYANEPWFIQTGAEAS